MQNYLKLVVFYSFVFIVLGIHTSFTPLNNVRENDNSCFLTVKNSDGSRLAHSKVTTDVSGSIACIGGRDFYTDKNGEVTLKWVKGCKLTRIYVKGTGYKVNYEDGKSYTLTIN
jgi:hypothetical protein